MEHERLKPLLICMLLAAGGVQATEAPLAVSPGYATTLALIGDTCPTFSWGAAPGAEGYELVVYRVGEEGEEAKPVLRQTFAGSASLWTPPLDRCLERGCQYAWSVRAVGQRGASEWSPLSLFEVVSGPSQAEFDEALAIVRQYLEEGSFGTAPGSGEGAGSRVGNWRTAVSPSARGSTAGPAPHSGAAGDPDLQVNGAAVVTTATLGAGVGAKLCLAVDYRYVDRGDGTVLDCNTGLLWLKDASCADLAGTDAAGRANWVTAESAAAALADATCGLTDGSSPGDWRQPTISEFCSAWAGTGLVPCPASAASDSLIDSSVGPPTVANAKGDAVWSEGDAFVGVHSSGYWSATEFDADNVWVASLSSGSVPIFTRDGNLLVWPVRVGP